MGKITNNNDIPKATKLGKRADLGTPSGMKFDQVKLPIL